MVVRDLSLGTRTTEVKNLQVWQFKDRAWQLRQPVCNDSISNPAKRWSTGQSHQWIWSYYRKWCAVYSLVAWKVQRTQLTAICLEDSAKPANARLANLHIRSITWGRVMR